MNYTKLVIVESPNKIKKIQALLGDDFKVMASVGHIRGLPLNTLGVHRDKNYQLDYQIDEDKKKVIASIVAETKKVGRNHVLLATDPDREGEAIAFHLAEILGISKDQACRIMFHELTQKAIQTAIQQPTQLNFTLIKAQEARRAIDRLAGFEVSDMLNKKLTRLTKDAYSAGRVQSPALKLIVEREKAIEGFSSQPKFGIKARFLTKISHEVFNRDKLLASYTGQELSKEDIICYFQSIAQRTFRIANIEKITNFRNPSPPFTTSTLQQDAIKKFKWGAKKVMEVAQQLFEQGHITYMRTDSPNLSEEAIWEIEQQLIKVGKTNTFQKNIYKAKTNAQEAHEAIRPTHFEQRTAGENQDQQQLYTLIYLRAIASQMIPAQYVNDKITITDITDGKLFISNKKTLVEAGFLAMYSDLDDDSEEDTENEGGTIHGKIAIGDELDFFEMTSKGNYTNPPKRFDEAGLVKELEKRGIGRPSTYATILNQVIAVKQYAVVNTIPPLIQQVEVIQLNHEYQIKTLTEKQSVGGDKNKLIPSERGIAIIEFLENHFKQMMNYEFTADIEEQLDLITEGKSNYLTVMQNFDAKHTQSIQHCQNLTEIGGTQRKTTFIGNIDGKPLSYGKTEKGAYLLFENAFYNLTDDTIPDVSQAQQIINQINQERKLKIIHQVKDLVVKNGQYGFYIEDKKGNKAPLKMEVEAIKQLDYQTLSDKLKAHISWKKNKK
ncbi:type I DNA topoisomerase [Arcicella sp. LKC2W]|uniref:type I DNA topoisomerase n=1 Tax=Arcicella sp. LKC2W TaxID=2984198 RepID=UPI002B1F6049|nr:type I DNA topoisomerase [Arcicella sp. LKC2W]MEA5462052.1 type I DNA topoisomerase [Arcicella sp. LKC2W]